MPMPASWVDHLFAKLGVRWGAAFLRQWPDTDPMLVKADWAEVLDGIRGESLSYALRYLPATPCNAVQFRDLCRKAPPANVPALPAPQASADPQRLQAIMAKLAKPEHGSATPAQVCAENILRVCRVRGTMSPPQRDQLRAMSRLLTAAQREEASRWLQERNEAIEEAF